jgi:hypothetical protein
MIDNILVIEDFVKQAKLLHEVRKRYVDQGMKYGWKSNGKLNYDFGHWNHLIMSNSKYFKYDLAALPGIDKHPEVKAIWGQIKEMLGERILIRCYINGYTYGTDAYAHTDDSNITKRFGDDALSESIIIYLNKTWERDWSGETVIYKGDEIERSVLPKFNRMLAFNSELFHAARPLARSCPELRIVLVFKTGAAHINDPLIDYLIPLTKDVPHSGRTFLDHLISVMRILEKYKQPKNVCAAGLFHSIYGTEYFKIDLGITREAVRELIGSYAEYLVYEFCTIKNRLPTLVINVNKYPVNVQRDLLYIELANVEDQNRNGKSDKKIKLIRHTLAILKDK